MPEMNRIAVDPLPGAPPGREVSVGCDVPLRSYFVQVLDPGPDGEDTIVLAQGATRHNEIVDSRTVLDLTAQYGTVPLGLEQHLRALTDPSSPSARPDTVPAAVTDAVRAALPESTNAAPLAGPVSRRAVSAPQRGAGPQL